MTSPYVSGSYPSGSTSIVDRMRRAASLDASLYEEVEHDTSATGQAAVIVALAAVATAIGNLGRGGTGLLAGLGVGLLGWAAWSGVAYLVGTRVFGGRATWGEVARTVGFAQTPALLLAFAFLPVVGGLVRLVVWIWTLVTGFIALRQALDLSGGKVFLTALIGSIALGIIQSLTIALLGLRLY